MDERLSVLVVDDNPAVLKFVHAALGVDFRAISADGPERALELLTEAPYHALVTDAEMPGMSGANLIRRARVLHPAITCVLISGNPGQKGHAEALGVPFLAKPFRVARLLAVLRTALRLDDS